ncbi:MAG: hypothetical protein ACYCQJ_16305, partial [Nitrososphaerales archaeon]
MDPLLQLAASPTEMWTLISDIAQGKTGHEKMNKTPSSITPFKCLQGLDYANKLDLLNKIHKGEATWQEVERAADNLKLNEQILNAWQVDCEIGQREKIYKLWGDHRVEAELNRWRAAFKQLGKG